MSFPYEEPDLTRLMLRDHLDVTKDICACNLSHYTPDFIYLWEDCCGSTGPFISPAMFEAYYAPWYRELKDFVQSMGVAWVILDTDGDLPLLAPLYYHMRYIQVTFGEGFLCVGVIDI